MISIMELRNCRDLEVSVPALLEGGKSVLSNELFILLRAEQHGERVYFRIAKEKLERKENDNVFILTGRGLVELEIVQYGEKEYLKIKSEIASTV